MNTTTYEQWISEAPWPLEPHEIYEYLVNIGIAHEWADDYGEPGYQMEDGCEAIILGDWWCHKCQDDDGKPALHDVMDHYAAWRGVLKAEYNWYDEYTVVNVCREKGNDEGWEYVNLAYRTQPDSYGWKSSIMFDEESGEYLTPYDGIEAWIEVCLREGKGLSGGGWSAVDLVRAGFKKEGGDFYNGWHAGMTDDPAKELERAKKFAPEGAEVLAFLNENSQFYFTFSIWARENDEGLASC